MEFFCQEELSLISILKAYSVTDVSVDSDIPSFLLVTVQHSCCVVHSSTSSQEGSSRQIFICHTSDHSVVSLSCLSSPTRHSGFILDFPCLSPAMNQFLEPFIRETEIWVLWVLMTTGVSLLLAPPLSRQS